MSRDIKAEYIRLYGLELTNFGLELMERTKTGSQGDMTALVDKYANKINDISNADFEDNFNPDHGREQGKPF